ncbi:hypothetical protein [Cytobacillus praedii]|uniref:hypothetical protein n=1 Tax=Cytobacillus praedii TaxID=1742358 RepID=UPI002E209566|nr:hypothetical protein [Cytobacillus praedii]
MKKITVMLIMIIGFLLIGSNAFASEIKNVNGINFSEKDLENLRSIGYTDQQLNLMAEEEYLANKDTKGELVSSDIKYIKTIYPDENNLDESITIELDKETFEAELEAELEAEENEMGTMAAKDEKSTEYLLLETQIFSIEYGKKYQLRNTATWKKIPTTRRWDISGIGFGSQWQGLPETKYAKQMWTKCDTLNRCTDDYSDYGSSSSYWQTNATGYAHKMNLPDNEGTQYVRNISSYALFQVQKISSTSSVSAYGHYSHQKKNLNISPAFSVSGTAISVSPSDHYDSPLSTHAYINIIN